MAQIEPGWDKRGLLTPMGERYPRLWHPGDEETVALCLHCGHPIEPPVVEAFWCREGCRRGWELALAQKRLLECNETPRPPREGYPLLTDDLCDT